MRRNRLSPSRVESSYGPLTGWAPTAMRLSLLAWVHFTFVALQAFDVQSSLSSVIDIGGTYLETKGGYPMFHRYFRT